MKKMKKLASLLLAAIMVLAMAVPAMAAGTEGSITVKDMADRTLKAYQIFSGTQASGEVELGNIVWGNGVDSAKFLAALIAAKDSEGNSIFGGIDEESTAKDVAEVVSKYTAESNNDKLQLFAELAVANKSGDGILLNNSVESTTTTVSSGYYVVADETSYDRDATDTVINVALLQVTNGDQEVHMKTAIPSVEKDVQDNDDQVGDTTDLGSSADKDNNNEKWGETADYNIGDVVPFRLKAVIPKSVGLAQYDTYEVIFHDTMSAGLTFEEFKEVRLNGKKLESGYKVSDNAVKGTEGQLIWTITIDDVKTLDGVNISEDIEIEVEYTATLNTAAKLGGNLAVRENNNDVYLEYSNNPSGTGTGKTTDDNVYVFTFTVPGEKVDQDNKPLAGASFALYREVKGVGGDVTSRDYAKLDGSKVIGWENITPDAEGKYNLEGKGVGEVTSGEDGLFAFEGLDAGTYMLQETVTPDGYNTAPDSEVTISVSKQEENAEGGATATVEVSPEKSIIKNNKGATLPETGGIGTTIFYVLGTILVVGAVILLVTKKRMSVEK